MKKNWILAAVFSAILFSCSSDSDGNDGEMLDSNTLVGTWNLTDARFEESSSLNFADEALDVLVAQNCFLVTFAFNADGSASSEDKVNYLLQNAGTGGLSVDCPTESDTETFTWSLEGNQLTITDGNQVSETIAIEFENNTTLVIAGEDINANNYSGAEAVFTKE